MSDPRTITLLLQRCRQDADDDNAFEELVPLVYDDLRRIAHQQLQRLRPGKTLDTTALAHESYIKLKNHADLDLNDRRHFYAVAARAMRQIVVDYARRNMAAKRDGIEVELNLDRTPETGQERSRQALQVHELLQRLESVNEDLVRIVEYRYFAGFTQEEIADILEVSVRTVQRRWQVARALLREMALEADERD